MTTRAGTTLFGWCIDNDHETCKGTTEDGRWLCGCTECKNKDNHKAKEEAPRS